MAMASASVKKLAVNDKARGVAENVIDSDTGANQTDILPDDVGAHITTNSQPISFGSPAASASTAGAIAAASSPGAIQGLKFLQGQKS